MTNSNVVNTKAVIYWLHLKEHKNLTKEGYIGVSKNPKKRLNEHRRLLKNGEHENNILLNVFQKYGSKILETKLVEGLEQYCYEIEEKLRPTYNIGWNINKGGFRPPSRQNKIAWNKNHHFRWITNNIEEKTLDIGLAIPYNWKLGRLKTSIPAGWSKGLTKETDPRVANNAKACQGIKKSGSPWNKGFTKETDERVKKIGEANSKHRKGKATWNKGIKAKDDPRVAKSVSKMLAARGIIY